MTLTRIRAPNPLTECSVCNIYSYRFSQHSLTYETSTAGNSLNLVFQLVYETRPLLIIGNLYVTFSPLRKYSLSSRILTAGLPQSTRSRCVLTVTVRTYT